MNYLQGWSEIAVAFLILNVYFINYFLYGFAFATVLKVKNKDFGLCIVSGFFIFSFVFGAFVLPLKSMVIPLDIIAKLWRAIWLLTVILIIFCCWKRLKTEFVRYFKAIKDNGTIVFIFCMITLIQVVFEELYGRYTNGSGAAWFNAYVCDAVFDNYLGITNPVSGEKMNYFYEAYFLQTYNDHSAVISKLTKLSPLLEIRTIMATMVIVVGNLLVYEIAKELYDNNQKKLRIVFFAIYIAVMGFWVPCVYMPSYYYYFRTFEGKTIFGMLLIPYVIFLLMKLYRKQNDRYIQGLLITGLLGSYTFCMSTMYILPFVFLSYVPMIFFDKKMFKNLCIGLIPCVVVMVYYILIRQGIVVLSIG